MKSSRERRGVLLLPSLFTTGNLLLGFLAIVRGLEGRFAMAATLIFVAGVLDGLDGRVARFAGAETDFGREYDSLADLTTFGIAPAVLAHLWGLNELGRIGWLVPFFYIVCTATRLARFNVQQARETVGKRFFVGLPSPAAGGSLASVLFIAPDNDWKTWLNLLLLLVVIGLALLMVSTFRYASSSALDPRRKWPVRVVLLVAAVLLVVAYHPPAFFVSAAAVYTCSGPLAWLRGKLRPRLAGEIPADSEVSET